MAPRRRPLPNRFLEYIFRPLALLIFAIIGFIYKVLFGWWLGPWLNHLGEKRLKEDIQQSVPSLFAEHGGKFVPNSEKARRGSESVTVLTEGMLFQINRWRDELMVKVASESKPTELCEVRALVKNSKRLRASQPPEAFFTLGQFSRFLAAHFETIRGEMQDRSESQRES
jgi:hypothetical protein